MSTNPPTLDSLGLNSTNDQQRNVNTTYAIGLINNKAARGQADLGFAQRIQALQNKLASEQAALPNSYAARGLLNSGIYNFAMPSGGNFSNQGALQQFNSNSVNAQGNLVNQQAAADQGYDYGNDSLGLAWTDASSDIPGQSAADTTTQAIADAVKGV